MVLSPIRKLYPQLIVEEWENIQRIMVSLALKTTTQSIIVGKLSAYARKNKTRRALWEYDNIIRSLYLLDYIDSPPLRQQCPAGAQSGRELPSVTPRGVLRQLRQAAFQDRTRTTALGRMRRLLTNCIIYYNAALIPAARTKKRTGMCRGRRCSPKCHRWPGSISIFTAAMNFAKGRRPSIWMHSSGLSPPFH